MDINRKVAERRAQLQRERAIEEEKLAQERAAMKAARAAEEEERRNRARELMEVKKLEMLEQKKVKEAREREIRELAEQEAKSKINLIEHRLQSNKNGGSHVIPIALEGRSNDEVGEMQRLVSREADKKVEAYMRNLASKRATFGEKALVRVLFFSGVLGFIYAWWLGLGVWVLWLMYWTRVDDRHVAEVKLEIGMK